MISSLPISTAPISIITEIQVKDVFFFTNICRFVEVVYEPRTVEVEFESRTVEVDC